MALSRMALLRGETKPQPRPQPTKEAKPRKPANSLQQRIDKAKAIVLEHYTIEECNQQDEEQHTERLVKITHQDQSLISCGYRAVLQSKVNDTFRGGSDTIATPATARPKAQPKAKPKAKPKATTNNDRPGTLAIRHYKDSVFNCDIAALSSHATKLYMLITAHCMYSRTLKVALAKRYIQEKCGISARYVKMAAEELHECGLIIYHPGNRTKRSQFELSMTREPGTTE